MDSGSEKRCLLCGQMVPPNAVKCSACGKGRFETEKRHPAPRPARVPAPGGAGTGVPPRAAGPKRAEPAAPTPAPAPAAGLLSRLFGRLTKKP
jgi:hypothetical protein